MTFQGAFLMTANRGMRAMKPNKPNPSVEMKLGKAREKKSTESSNNKTSEP